MKLGQRDGRWVIVHDDHTVISTHATKDAAVAEFTRLRAKPPNTGCKHAHGIETMRMRLRGSTDSRVDVAAGSPGSIRLVGSGWEMVDEYSDVSKKMVDGGFRNPEAAVVITYGRWCKMCGMEVTTS